MDEEEEHAVAATDSMSDQKKAIVEMGKKWVNEKRKRKSEEVEKNKKTPETKKEKKEF